MQIRIWKQACAIVLALLANFANAADSTGPLPYLTLGFSEGASADAMQWQLYYKYQPLADAIGRAIGREVRPVWVGRFQDLETGLKAKRYDFAIARPTDYMARALRNYGYQYVVNADQDSACQIIVRKDSPLNRLEDIAGKRIALPAPDAYMTKLCTADLARKGIDLNKFNLKHMAEQDFITAYLDQQFVDVGIVGSNTGVAKRWVKQGNRVLYQTTSWPYFPLIAKQTITVGQVDKVRKALIDLKETDPGRALLQSLGITGFRADDESRLIALLPWLGEKDTAVSEASTPLRKDKAAVN